MAPENDPLIWARVIHFAATMMTAGGLFHCCTAEEMSDRPPAEVLSDGIIATVLARPAPAMPGLSASRWPG